VETDLDGRFQLSSFGENRLAIIEVEGPSIAKRILPVVTRDMEAISARPLGVRGFHESIYYGRDFEFVAGPSQTIQGRVTDGETGQPLINVDGWSIRARRRTVGRRTHHRSCAEH
jgi:hypothetical protein